MSRSVVIIVLVFLSTWTSNGNPLSKEFIDKLNSMNLTWRAGQNFHPNTPMSIFKDAVDLRQGHEEITVVKRDVISNLPERFEAKEKWINCPSINEIRDEGACHSSWAVTAAGVMTDRYCIANNGTKQFHFSAQDLLTCCGELCGNCEGGHAARAMKYFYTDGVVSGEGYGSEQGCKPYSFVPCDHVNTDKATHCGVEPETPKCSYKCQKNYKRPYLDDRQRATFIYKLHGEATFMTEIYNNGPIEGFFQIYEDFLSYKSGVYIHTTGSRVKFQAVKIVGWGVENGVKYWKVAMTWNKSFGENGFFKILRGEDHCQIEEAAITGSFIQLY